MSRLLMLATATRPLAETLFSALVTEHGSAKEKPINIVTPWDFVAGAFR